MTTNNLLTQIEDTLARDSANVSANLINIAQIFAQLDERFAAMETKLERLLTVPPAAAGAATNFNARVEQLTALLDERIATALAQEQQALCEATAEIMRGVLAEFITEFKNMCSAVEAKLADLKTLLAQRSPLDQPVRNERPN